MNNLRNIDIVTSPHPFPKNISLLFRQKLKQFVGAVFSGHSVSIHSNPYRQFVGTADDRQGSGIINPLDFRCPTISEHPQERRLPSDRRETPSRLRSAFRNGWGRIKAWNAVIDDSLAGDILGLVALVVMICVGVFFAGVLR